MENLFTKSKVKFQDFTNSNEKPNYLIVFHYEALQEIDIQAVSFDPHGVFEEGIGACVKIIKSS